MERIDRVDHELQQAVPELGVARVRRPATAVAAVAAAARHLLAALPSGDGAAGAAAAAAPAAAAGLPGRRYAAAAARTRRAAHARLVAVGRVRMLLKHRQAISALNTGALSCVSRVLDGVFFFPFLYPRGSSTAPEWSRECGMNSSGVDVSRPFVCASKGRAISGGRKGRETERKINGM